MTGNTQNGEPDSSGGTKGDREAFNRAFARYCHDNGINTDELTFWPETLDFLESPAGITAFDSLIGRDSLAAELAEARADNERLRTERHALETEVRRVNGIRDRLRVIFDEGGPLEDVAKRIVDERDALKQRVEELEDQKANKDARIEWLKGERQALRTQVASAHMALNRAGCPEDGSLQNKVDWAVSRLSPETETDEKQFSDIDILKSSAKYMDLRVTELEKWRERVCERESRQ